MMWLGRTLPVSVVLHAAAGLFRLPALSREALPESRGPRWSIVPMPVVQAPARSSAPLPTSGGGRRGRSSTPMPVADRPPAGEPARVADDEAGMIIDEPTGDPVGSEGPGSDGPDPGGPGGEGGKGIGSPGPVRPGGDLQPPAKVRDVAPVYPELARRAGVEGVVVLECVIDASRK